mmetsp:Transcript_10000/g.30702  ORF Transcript_10000/g.30702 Transcript_10000/m.30702 type:complete len:98 (-) Transcript_10000:905-1198(-)
MVSLLWCIGEHGNMHVVASHTRRNQSDAHAVHTATLTSIACARGSNPLTHPQSSAHHGWPLRLQATHPPGLGRGGAQIAGHGLELGLAGSLCDGALQ